MPANLRGEGIKVKTGYETTIMVYLFYLSLFFDIFAIFLLKVTPRVLHTTDSGQAMAFSDRQCRAAGEAAAAGLKIFRQYSREVIPVIH